MLFHKPLTIKRIILLVFIFGLTFMSDLLLKTHILYAKTIHNPFESYLLKFKEIVEKPSKPPKIIIEDVEVAPEKPRHVIKEIPIFEEKILPIDTRVSEKIIVTPPALKVSGLLWNANRPQAIVNDQIVDVGDRIKNSTIKSIHHKGIDIEFEGNIFTVRIEKMTVNPI